MVYTEGLQNKWTALGYALGIPSSQIEKINDKYHNKPLTALVRVYRYWLTEENGFVPTWKKLIDALRLIKEIDLSVQIAKTLEVSQSCINSQCTPANFRFKYHLRRKLWYIITNTMHGLIVSFNNFQTMIGLSPTGIHVSHYNAKNTCLKAVLHLN